MYLGVRKIAKNINFNKNTVAIFPQYVDKDYLTVHNKLGSKADKRPIELENGSVLDYTSEGPSGSLADAGGYIVSYPNNITESLIRNYLNNKNLVSWNWINLYFIFFYINRNSDQIVSNVITFNKSPAGDIRSKFETHTTGYSYSTSWDKFRLFLEIVFLIVTSHHWYLLLHKIWKQFYKDTVLQFKGQPSYMRKRNLILRVIGRFETEPNSGSRIGSRIKKSDSCASCICYVLKRLVFLIGRIIYLFLKSTLKFALCSISNFAFLLAMILILIQTSLWIKIVTEDKFYVTESGEAPGAYEYILNTTNWLVQYKKMASMITVLLIVRIYSYVTFSSKLVMFADILRKSSFEIFFFLSMYFIIMIGYACTGYALFGVSNEAFETFLVSLLTVFKMAVGAYSSYDIHFHSGFLKHLYGYTFVLANIILLNMATAIIISHYIEYYIEQGHLRSNALKLLLKSVISEEPPNTKDKESKDVIDWVKYRLVSNLRRWVYNIVKEHEIIVERTRYNPPSLKSFQQDMKEQLPTHIQLLLEESSEDDDFMEKDLKENIRKMHFWVALIDKYTSKMLKKDYILTLAAPGDNLFSERPKLSCQCNSIYDHDHD